VQQIKPLGVGRKRGAHARGFPVVCLRAVPFGRGKSHANAP
jgi:hypothetical protein